MAGAPTLRVKCKMVYDPTLQLPFGEMGKDLQVFTNASLPGMSQIPYRPNSSKRFMFSYEESCYGLTAVRPDRSDDSDLVRNIFRIRNAASIHTFGHVNEVRKLYNYEAGTISSFMVQLSDPEFHGYFMRHLRRTLRAIISPENIHPVSWLDFRRAR